MFVCDFLCIIKIWIRKNLAEPLARVTISCGPRQKFSNVTPTLADTWTISKPVIGLGHQGTRRVF